jgi:hypothetical protein
MKRFLHRLAITRVLSILDAAFAADMPSATAASVDAVHQNVLVRSELGPVIRPPAAIPNSSGRSHAVTIPAMSATDQHVREFLDWRERHAPSRGGIGGSLR